MSGALLPDPVEILVGPSERQFLAPRRVLTKAPFFEACLDAPMQESLNGVIKLPEDDADAFVEILSYMFIDILGERLGTRMVDVSSSQGRFQAFVLREIDMPLAVRTYNLARKLGMEKLSNAIMDRIELHHSMKSELSCEEFVYAFNSPEMEEILRAYFVQRTIPCIRSVGWESWVKQNQDVYRTVFDGNSAGMGVLVAETLPAKDRSRRRHTVCEWHVHFDSPKCDQPAATPKSRERKRPRLRSPSLSAAEPSYLVEDSDS